MRYNAEIFDQLQFLFETTKFNDHQLHCVINFQGKVNKDILKKSIVLMIQIVPILGCLYVTDKGKPYWESVDCGEMEDVIIFTEDESKFSSFITSKINECNAPQMKACLLSSTKDSLAIIINHMVFDGADFKEYLYLLSELYSRLVKDPSYMPNYKINGDRSLKKINDEFRLKDKLKALFFQNNQSNKTSPFLFPMSSEKEVNPFILTYKIPENRYLVILEYCKNHKFTLNDVVLSAYYRVLYKMLDIGAKGYLNIPIMVDMRRNIKNKKIDAFCNLSSTAITHIDNDINDNFYDTVVKVNKDMKLKKGAFIGLNGFIKLSLIFGTFNYKISNIMVKKYLRNPPICMTNIGILDSTKLLFERVAVEDAFMCGSIKYKPHFQLALTSFNNSITFSVNLYGGLKDKENIENFFDLFDKELPG